MRGCMTDGPWPRDPVFSDDPDLCLATGCLACAPVVLALAVVLAVALPLVFLWRRFRGRPGTATH